MHLIPPTNSIASTSLVAAVVYVCLYHSHFIVRIWFVIRSRGFGSVSVPGGVGWRCWRSRPKVARRHYSRPSAFEFMKRMVTRSPHLLLMLNAWGALLRGGGLKVTRRSWLWRLIGAGLLESSPLSPAFSTGGQCMPDVFTDAWLCDYVAFQVCAVGTRQVIRCFLRTFAAFFTRSCAPWCFMR